LFGAAVFSVDTFSGVFVLESLHKAATNNINKQIIVTRICEGFMRIAIL
jgi:hypothetical protein